MTPFGGYLIALVVGYLVPRPRRAILAVLAPWLAVLAVQTWNLLSGRGHNPASVVTPVYFAVQLIILAPIIGLVAGLSDWRSRHPAGLDPLVHSRHVAVLSLVLTILAAGIAFGLLFAFPTPPAQRGTGSGDVPLAGVIGLALSYLMAAIFGMIHWRARRAASEPARRHVMP